MTSSRFHRRITMLAHQSARPRCLPWQPGALLVALLVGLSVASPALSAVRLGTSGPDTLLGTNKADRITGAGGDDSLIGKANDDTYFFADNWGTDTLIEKDGEGSDTVDFHAVTNGPVHVSLVPEWVDVDPTINGATGPNGTVQFAYVVNGQTTQSIVENAIGGRGNGGTIEDADVILGGAGKNVLQPGGGGLDGLTDVGGWSDGADGTPDIPVSNDVYKGFADNTGTDYVQDWGGNGDVLDLRPFSTGDVFATAIDLDGSPDRPETLQIVTGLTGQVIIPGHFGDMDVFISDLNYHGHIETIIFANKTFSTTSGLQSMTVASTEALSGKQAKLAKAADRLAEEARAQLATMPEPGMPTGSRRGGVEGGPKPAGESATPHNQADTKHTPATRAPRDNKQATKTKAQHETNHKQAKHGAQDRQRRQP